MTGQEFRFLRGLLDLTQTAVGRRLGHAGYQTVASWERKAHHAVPSTADAMMRAWYLESVGERPMITMLTEKLMTLPSPDSERRRVFRESRSGTGWRSEMVPREMVSS